jgi:hypothetical protein
MNILEVNRKFRDQLKKYYVKQKKTANEAKALAFDAMTKKELALMLDLTANDLLREFDRQARDAIYVAVPDPEATVRGNVTQLPNARRKDAIAYGNRMFADGRLRGADTTDQWSMYRSTMNERIYVPSLDDRILIGNATFDEIEEAVQHVQSIVNGADDLIRGLRNIQAMLVEFKEVDCKTGFEVTKFIEDNGGEKQAQAVLETKKQIAS